MKYINPIHKVNNDVPLSKLIDFGFRKLFTGEIVYRFPVYKYNGKPIVYAEFIYNTEENQIHIHAVDNKGSSCSYNKEEYGKSSVVEIINIEINKTIQQMKKNGLIK